MKIIAKKYRKAPAIRELALYLTQNLPSKNWLAETRAVQKFVRSHIRYVKDIRGVETVQTPIQTLKIGQGDCDDQSILVASLLEAIGHPTRFVAVGFAPQSFSHVYAETKIGGKWVPVETTENWPVGRSPKKIQAKMVRHV